MTKKERQKKTEALLCTYTSATHPDLPNSLPGGWRTCNYIISALDVAETGDRHDVEVDLFFDEHRLAFGTKKHLACFIIMCKTNLGPCLHLRIGRIEKRAPAGRTPRDGELSSQLRSTFPSRCETQTATPWIRSSASTGMSGYF